MTGKKTVLSEQNLQDCLPGTRGKKWKCGGTGGDPKEALSKVRDIGGIYLLKDYPWIEGNARCRKIHKKPAITGREYKVMKEFGVTNDRLMKLVKEFGPVSALVTKKEMLKIIKKNVIITSCTGTNDHSVTVVGWDTTPDNVRYWIVKNSWGKKYGDKGYYYIKMSAGNFDCNIKSEITYLTPA